MTLALLSGLAATPASAAVDTRDGAPDAPSNAGLSADLDPPPLDENLSPEAQADVLGHAVGSEQDFTWELVGDSVGLHVLVGRASDGFHLDTVATLAVEGIDTDRWVGNGCLTSDATRLVVSYGPRQFTNEEQFFLRGAFVSVVDLSTGTVTHSEARSSLEYFTPSCGIDNTAVVTASGGDTIDGTLISVIDSSSGAVTQSLELDAQVTSAVQTSAGLVGAAGSSVVRVADDGGLTSLATTTSTAFDLTVDADGGLVYLDHDAATAQVERLSPTALAGAEAHAAVTPFAEAPLDDIGLTASADGQVLVTGDPRAVDELPATVDLVDSPAHGELTTLGTALVELDSVTPLATDVDAGATTEVTINLAGMETDRTAALRGSIAPVAALSPDTETADGSSGAAARTSAARLAGDPHDPVEAERTCAVPRNDPANQVLQPKPRQVEWAVNRAVTGTLTIQRPANWNNLGMPAYTPKGLVGTVPLAGSTTARVPSQIVLGALAQESNLWQTQGNMLPGMTGNPLIGSFYGLDYDAATDDSRWDIDFDRADCGYGVGQITDGMRLPAYVPAGGVPSYPYQTQRAIALDYAVNVQVATNMLAEKWNQTRAAGLIVNDGNPARIENWFFAVWAYNSGFYPEAAKNTESRNGAWGVGWANNPANPSYPANRARFMKSASDAAKPQNWPYPEKVLGWAASPPTLFESPGTSVVGYRAAYWIGSNPDGNRESSKPPVNAFCTTLNDCAPGTTQIGQAPDVDGYSVGPCQHRDSAGRYDGRCWYHGPVTWKSDCDTQCGRELLRFDNSYMTEQANGDSYPPVCARTGLPSGALVVDDIAASDPVVRPGCSRSSTSAGTFEFTFGSRNGEYPSKVDLHQVGGGYDGHFWFGHARQADLRGGSMKIEGTWTLDRALNQWTRVLVHVPDIGAHSQDARYTITYGKDADGNDLTSQRTLPQRIGVNQWVSLGVFRVDGVVPSVKLTTDSWVGDPYWRQNDREDSPYIVTNQDVAFDAVAFQPLAAKPADIVVALGDSYSSGEGGSEDDGVDYYPVSDNNGNSTGLRNACHRSPYTWSRVARLGGSVSTIGQRADTLDPTLEYHLIACSGARTYNLMPQHTTDQQYTDAGGTRARGQYGEPSQLDQGYLDENTTLVTLSIGGNDVGFSEIITACIADVPVQCDEKIFDGEDLPLWAAFPHRVDDHVRPSLVTTLQLIHSRAPNAKILLMGYPEVMSGTGVPFVSEQELAYSKTMVATLNAGMSRATTTFNEGVGSFVAGFADPVPEFRGQGAGGSPEMIHALITNPTPGESILQPISQQSFHPKIGGYELYADAFERRLSELGW